MNKAQSLQTNLQALKELTNCNFQSRISQNVLTFILNQFALRVLFWFCFRLLPSAGVATASEHFPPDVPDTTWPQTLSIRIRTKPQTLNPHWFHLKCELLLRQVKLVVIVT